MAVTVSTSTSGQVQQGNDGALFLPFVTGLSNITEHLEQGNVVEATAAVNDLCVSLGCGAHSGADDGPGGRGLYAGQALMHDVDSSTPLTQTLFVHSCVGAITPTAWVSSSQTWTGPTIVVGSPTANISICTAAGGKCKQPF